MEEESECCMGSGNVFADLGLPDAEELQLKSYLGMEIRITIKAKRLSRRRAAQKMGMSEDEIAKLYKRAPFDYSVGQLVRFLNSLDRDVELSATVRERVPRIVESAQAKAREAAAA